MTTPIKDISTAALLGHAAETLKAALAAASQGTEDGAREARHAAARAVQTLDVALECQRLDREADERVRRFGESHRFGGVA